MNGNRKSGGIQEITVIILGRSVCAYPRWDVIRMCARKNARCCEILHHQVSTDTATVTLIIETLLRRSVAGWRPF